MAGIADELKTYLKTISAVTALVGTGNDARIFKQDLKQGTALPAITIQVFAGRSEEHLGGITGMAANRVQVDCYATTEAGAYALAEAVRLAPLQMLRGTMGSTYIHSVNSNGGYENGNDPVQRGTDARRYWTSRDYLITYQEATS